MNHIEQYIDNTYLNGGNKEHLLSEFMSTYKGAFRALCTEEKMLPIAKKAKELFPSSPTKLALVRNFPYGTSLIANPLLDRVIDEYDVVIPHKLIMLNKSEEFQKYMDVYYRTGRTIKWIIEEPLYEVDEIFDIVKFIYNFYAQGHYNNKVYIKSNSGFVKRIRTLKKVTETFIKIVGQLVPKGHFGIKISGGVSTLKDAKRVAQEGCIIGSSKGLSIFYEQQDKRYDNAEKRIIEG